MLLYQFACLAGVGIGSKSALKKADETLVSSRESGIFPRLLSRATFPPTQSRPFGWWEEDGRGRSSMMPDAASVMRSFPIIRYEWR